ncbi:MAG TPA: helix-turn-helix transcriptional regulator, partial [Candidatus Elarobacter sp.]|nr:helix-turn-helix transcriptional regulator [Candidatus Elarobacter sp.]
MRSHFRETGSVLRHARKARRISQEALSKQLGISPATLSRAEQGTQIQFGTLQQIARALDLEPVLVPRRLVPAVNAIVESDMRGTAFSFDPNEDA